MRVFDNGAFYTVSVSAREVENFGDRWPASGLEFRPVTFTFDKRNGDIVDSDDAERHPDADGSALAALSEDAMRYGADRLGINLHR